MSVKTGYSREIACDFCPAKILVFSMVRDTTQKELIREARVAGWSIGKTVKCPECQGKRQVITGRSFSPMSIVRRFREQRKGNRAIQATA